MFPTKALLDAAVSTLKRAQQGLFQGRAKQYGNNVPFSKRKTRRTWMPNIQQKNLYSETLESSIRIKITTRAYKTIKKFGGIDNYVMNTKPELLGWQGMRIRLLVQDVLNEQQRRYVIAAPGWGPPDTPRPKKEDRRLRHPDKDANEPIRTLESETESSTSDVEAAQEQAPTSEVSPESTPETSNSADTATLHTTLSFKFDSSEPSSSPSPKVSSSPPAEPKVSKKHPIVLGNERTKELRLALQRAQHVRKTQSEFDLSIYGRNGTRPTLEDARKIREEAGKLLGTGKAADWATTLRYIENKRLQQCRTLGLTPSPDW
ncbi:hypothetical protein HGRIS_012179 [Hohenbuehelia grisea]|uniref:Mitochondrial ribosomal protein L28 n=1 Tax=Hohenbuehelia grisea TaxID=104357 RepID=A0ABR3IRJ7_9AGAR